MYLIPHYIRAGTTTQSLIQREGLSPAVQSREPVDDNILNFSKISFICSSSTHKP